MQKCIRKLYETLSYKPMCHIEIIYTSGQIISLSSLIQSRRAVQGWKADEKTGEEKDLVER